MSNTSLSFSGRKITVGNQTWKAEYSVHDAALVSGRVIVLYRWSIKANLSLRLWKRQFRNLAAYSLDGRRLWIGEHPTTGRNDVYLNFISTAPLRVWSFACYVCEIDVTSGKLLHAEFTK